MLRIVLSIVVSLCGSLQLFGTTPAVRLLSSVHYSHSLPSVIDQNEWKELQLDRLITQLDRTKTSFGRWGLTHLLQPIADRSEISKRQKIISFLVENDDVLEHFQKQLLKVKKHESSLLAYWDTRDELNRKCDQFYYVIPGFKNYLNKSSAALNLGVAVQMLDAGRNLLMALCLGGVSDEFLGWTMGGQKDFNLKRGIENGLKQPWRQHSFTLDKLQGREFDKYTTRDYFTIGTRGSFGDRYHMLLNGFSFDASDFGLPDYFSLPAQKAVGFFGKGAAFLSAALPTACYDYVWGVSLVSVSRYITSMHTSLKGLTGRVVDVTTCFDGMARIINEMQLHTDLFGKYVYFNQDHEIGMNVIQEIAKKQRAHKHLYHYSRGHVLAMHREIKQVKSTIIPVLQTIALLDAFCSIAQLYKEHAHKQNTFSFVTFVEAHEPFVSYHDAWLALLSDKQAVSNDVYLGKEYAGKIIITGPNGGGKSTLLKTVGVAAVLAQSWGIVPASKAEQTIFSGIKTGLAPHEDLQQGMSTFMAEKKCMEQIDTFIKRTQAGRNALVLIDEPYKGTVDEESAKRIYNFGMNIAPNPHTLLCIATHVKKPILLATDTHGVFANYHVEITEERPGVFNRLFKLKQGPASWWFENEGQRGRFVDWISTQM